MSVNLEEGVRHVFLAWLREFATSRLPDGDARNSILCSVAFWPLNVFNEEDRNLVYDKLAEAEQTSLDRERNG